LGLIIWPEEGHDMSENRGSHKLTEEDHRQLSMGLSGTMAGLSIMLDVIRERRGKDPQVRAALVDLVKAHEKLHHAVQTLEDVAAGQMPAVKSSEIYYHIRRA